jgi:hypothetical protein
MSQHGTPGMRAVKKARQKTRSNMHEILAKSSKLSYQHNTNISLLAVDLSF